jgi:hypothetical protein
MVQRVIFPLAYRSFLLSVVVAGITSVLITPVGILGGAQGPSATLRDVSAGVPWTGSATHSNAAFHITSCEQAQTCDRFTLTIDISDEYRKLHPDFAASIRLNWEDSNNNFDLYVSKDGQVVDNSSQGQTNWEEVRLDRPANGVFDIFTHAASSSAGATFSGIVRIVASPSNAPRRNARYEKDSDGKNGPAMFQFAPEIQINRAAQTDNVRTDVAIDPFDNIYVAADGSDLALAEPEAGLGKLYARPSPEWAAAVGATRLFVASIKEDRLVVRHSDDQGRTFKQEIVVAQLSDPAAGIDLGNLFADRTGKLFTVFTGLSRAEVYLAQCASPCNHFVSRRIFTGGHDVNVAHPHPVIAVDSAGGIHVAFSDGETIFLISSADGGTTWNDPVAVNNKADEETAVALAPWIFAGDSGRVGLVWRGTAGDVYYSLTADAFAAQPVFNYVKITDPQKSFNLPSAALDPYGNANIVYGQAVLERQIRGERLLFGPFETTAGMIKTETGVKHVSFNMRQDFTGTLTYLDEQRRLSLRSARFNTGKRDGEKISLSGRGTLQDGTNVTFTVVTGNSTTANKDFSISMSNGYFAAGTLQETPSTEAKVHKAERH